jgi:hypothetical protein
MPLLSRKEFLEICGCSHATLSMNIKRGKVFVEDDKRIDTSLPRNNEFMNKQIKKLKAKVISKDEGTPIIKNKQQKPITEDTEPSGRAAEDTQKYNLELQAKELDIEIKEQKVIENKLKIAKLQGDVIPTDLVSVVFAQHFKSVTTAFHQGADNFLMIMQKELGMSRKDMAKYRGELIGVINQAVKDGIKDSKSSVKSIVSEYSQKRGVGEKK